MNRLVSGVRSSGLVKIVMCFAALAFLLVFYGLAVHNTPETEAVMATDFQAGRIIDDAVFYNANTMSVEEIQAFLDEKLPTCDMWGTGSSAGRVVSETGYVMPAGSTNADYARLRAAAGNSRYHEPPYVCVNKYYENPETHETLYETNGIVKDGMISAAQIIYNEAQRYSINPQVLLVLLKKESYVWGDTWPLKWEYNSAMGYGCPDNAPCDTAYYGFYNQVHMAAYQFDRYKQKNYEYNYHPGMTNNIYYSPTYSCGTKQVYIENMATASLYIYTPYTPNDAALQNYPGTSYCGSYGNRNFFMYFSEWFGSTYENNWIGLLSPRVMTVSQDTLRIDADKNIATDEWAYEGQSFMFDLKKNVYLNGKVYSCLHERGDQNVNRCILYDRLKEYEPVIEDIERRTVFASSYTCRMELRTMSTGCKEELQANEIFSSSRKTTIGTVTFFVDETDESKGYRMDRFQGETYGNITMYDESKNVFIKEGAKKYSADLKTSSKKEKGISRIYGEVVIDHKTYYLLNNTGAIDIVAAEDTDEALFVGFALPRNMIISDNSRVINLTGYGICPVGALKLFDRKTYYDDEEYYVYKGSDCGIKAEDVSEIESAILNFVSPRNMVIKEGSDIYNLRLGGLCMENKSEMVYHFSKKAILDGRVYYIIGSDGICGVPSDDVVEISSFFSDFMYPRKMRAEGVFVNLFTGEKCRDGNNDIFLFNTKTERAGAIYYRTSDDTDTASACVISSKFAKDL